MPTKLIESYKLSFDYEIKHSIAISAFADKI